MLLVLIFVSANNMLLLAMQKKKGEVCSNKDHERVSHFQCLNVKVVFTLTALISVINLARESTSGLF